MALTARDYWKGVIKTMIKSGKEREEIIGSFLHKSSLFQDLKKEMGALSHEEFLGQLIDEARKEMEQTQEGEQ
jgi:hypothetical protein